MKKNTRSARLDSACAVALGLVAAGCMGGVENGPQLLKHDSTFQMFGLTANAGERVDVMAYNWCTNTESSRFNTTTLASNKMTFTDARAGTNPTGYAWSLTGSVVGANCEFWTPYGCSSLEWGPKQGTLRVHPKITRADKSTFNGYVFADPASGETHREDCVKLKMDANASLTETAANQQCADPDGWADVQVRDVSSTWAIDIDALKVVTTTESESQFLNDYWGDEIFNPGIVGVRTTLTADATLLTAMHQPGGPHEYMTAGNSFSLSDAEGRIHIDNVHQVSLADWIGCDPATARVNEAEFAKLAEIAAQGTANNPKLEEAIGYIKKIRCDLTTPMEISMIGYAVQPIEHDTTAPSTVRSVFRSEVNKTLTEKQALVQNVGAQLSAIRAVLRDTFAKCNSATARFASPECQSAFAAMQIPTLVIPPSPSTDADAIGQLISGGLIEGLLQVGGKDEAIGAAAIAMYVAVTPGFYALMQSRAGQTAPGGLQLLRTPAGSNEIRMSLNFVGDGGQYQITGKLQNFTAVLRDPAQVSKDRTRYGSTCPWPKPVESRDALHL